MDVKSSCVAVGDLCRAVFLSSRKVAHVVMSYENNDSRFLKHPVSQLLAESQQFEANR